MGEKKRMIQDSSVDTIHNLWQLKGISVVLHNQWFHTCCSLYWLLLFIFSMAVFSCLDQVYHFYIKVEQATQKLSSWALLVTLLHPAFLLCYHFACCPRLRLHVCVYPYSLAMRKKTCDWASFSKSCWDKTVSPLFFYVLFRWFLLFPVLYWLIGLHCLQKTIIIFSLNRRVHWTHHFHWC